MHLFFKAAFILGVLGIAAPPLEAQANDQASFYAGKTIQLIVGYGAGGGYDLYARLMARFLGSHVPGQPNVIVRNMPGGGGRAATAYAYKVAPQDGTTLVTADQGLILDQLLGDPAILFDLSKMPAIGNPIADGNNLVTWHTSGVQNIEDAKRKEVSIGAGPGASTEVPLVMNALLGTRFKIISGYTGGNDIDLAMERGEVSGRGQNSFAAWKASKPDWLKDRKINFIVQWGEKKQAGYEDVPLLADLATNPEDAALLRLFTVPTILGRPIFTTPNVSPERTDALRQAFDATMDDPAFRSAAEKGSFDINPVSGSKMTAMIAAALATGQSVKNKLKLILDAAAK